MRGNIVGGVVDCSDMMKRITLLNMPSQILAARVSSVAVGSTFRRDSASIDHIGIGMTDQVYIGAWLRR
jgi:hypothetical protein